VRKSGYRGYLLRYFAEVFGNFNAGDFIPYDIFDYKSVITNVQIKIEDWNKVSHTYDPGPLYDLVNGKVSVSFVSRASKRQKAVFLR
jgi:hypothetical protein